VTRPAEAIHALPTNVINSGPTWVSACCFSDCLLATRLYSTRAHTPHTHAQWHAKWMSSGAQRFRAACIQHLGYVVQRKEPAKSEHGRVLPDLDQLAELREEVRPNQ
jgi:hypothetical protein